MLQLPVTYLVNYDNPLFPNAQMFTFILLGGNSFTTSYLSSKHLLQVPILQLRSNNIGVKVTSPLYSTAPANCGQHFIGF